MSKKTIDTAILEEINFSEIKNPKLREALERAKASGPVGPTVMDFSRLLFDKTLPRVGEE